MEVRCLLIFLAAVIASACLCLVCACSFTPESSVGAETEAIDEPVVAGAASSSTEVPRQSLAAAKTEVAKMRDKYKNTLHLMTFFLSNAWNVSLCLLLSELEKPLMRQYTEQVSMCSTPKGTESWYIKQAVDGWAFLEALPLVMKDKALLRQCGFRMVAPAESEGELAVQEQRRLAEALMELMRAFVAQHVPTMALHTSTPPLMLAPLLSDEHSKATLARMRGLWELVERIETSYTADSFPRKFLKELLWTRSVAVRELFASCAECDWQHAPADMMARLEPLFRHWGGSRVVEQSFQKLTELVKTSSTQNLRRLHRWSGLATSNVITESGHRELQLLDGRADSADLEESRYRVTEEGFSLGAEAAREIAKENLPNQEKPAEIPYFHQDPPLPPKI
eukprot:6476345-Amphidinium_carterae.2